MDSLQIDLNHIELGFELGGVGVGVYLVKVEAADIHSLLVEVVGGDNVDFHGLFAVETSIGSKGDVVLQAVTVYPLS